MRTFSSCLKHGLRLFALLLGLLQCHTLPAAVNFTVTPSTVSNTYSGNITLQITGLGSGQTVVVQKFLDVNTNGVIDGADLLWQQFQLTDGQASVIGGVTNINVPGDTDATPGQITGQVLFQNGESALLNIIGKYAWKLSSPTGLFTPITNSFTITNAAYAQSLTGNVVNSGTNVPHAVVLAFHPPKPGDNGPGSIVAGAVANNLGRYSIPLPVGAYAAVALKSNYFGNLFPPPVTVGSGTTVTNNLTLTNATLTISGKLSDAANNAVGLPGLFVHATAGAVAATGNSDTNGNFTLRVGPGLWELGTEGLEALGYIHVDFSGALIDTTTGSVNGLVITYPKAAALFYGSVKDGLSQPLAGVRISSENDTYTHWQTSFSDSNGNYVAGTLGGEPWDVSVDNDQPFFTDYVFSEGLYTNISAGQAALQNFTALLATNRITGHLQNSGGSSISNVQIYAYAYIGSKGYYIETDTDTSGNYSLNVANGNWTVGVCFGCNDGSLGYCHPNDQNVTVSNANRVVDFTASGQMIITTPSPLLEGYVNDSYSFQFAAVACLSGAYWSATNPPSGLELSSSGELFGDPDTPGTNSFFVQVDDGSGSYVTKAFSLLIHPATTGGVEAYYVNKLTSYRQTNAASVVPDSSQGPYNTYLGIIQDSLGLVTNANCTLPTSAVKTFPSGISALELQVHETFASASVFDSAYPAGNYSFVMHTVNDGNQFPVLHLPVTNSPNAPHISNFSATQAINPGADFDLHWDAFSGGANDDFIWLTITDSNQVPAFALWWYPEQILDYWLDNTDTSTTIPAGTLQPGRSYLGVLRFLRVVDVNDVDYPGAYGQTFVTAQTVFNLTTASAVPTLNQPARLSATQFRFLLTGLAGQNYTIQKSTNLSTTNWSVLFITNAPVTSIQIIDPAATNSRAFYRALLGP